MESEKGFYKIRIVDFTKSTRTNMSLILKSGRTAQRGSVHSRSKSFGMNKLLWNSKALSQDFFCCNYF